MGRSWPWWRKVRAALEAAGVSMETFAAEIGRPPTSVRRWLRGELSGGPADATLLSEIADHFGWSVDYLIDEGRRYGEPPPARSTLEGLADLLPPDVRRIVRALEDPEAVAYLLGALDVYDRALAAGRAQGSRTRKRSRRRSPKK